jgi:hypothetical protein
MKSFTHPISPLPGRSLSKLTEDMANHARCIRELQGVKQSAPKTRPVGGGSAELEFPFQIYDTGAAFVSRAGTFNGVHDELTQAATTDGTWRLYASIVINVTTGEITDTDVAWYSSTQTDTATNYYHLIGTGVVADTGATRTVTNFNYGPIFFLLRGDVEGDWTVDFF